MIAKKILAKKFFLNQDYRKPACFSSYFKIIDPLTKYYLLCTHKRENYYHKVSRKETA